MSACACVCIYVHMYVDIHICKCVTVRVQWQRRQVQSPRALLLGITSRLGPAYPVARPKGQLIAFALAAKRQLL